MNKAKLKLWISPLGRCWAPFPPQKPALWSTEAVQWGGLGQLAPLSRHGKAVCPSQELQSRSRSVIPIPAFTHLSRSHSQRYKIFETLSWISLSHITPSNAQFVLILCFCPWSQSILLYPEAETLNPSKELEAARFRLQSISSMREGSPCTLGEPPQAIRRDSQAITVQPQEQAKELRVTQIPAQVEVSLESCFTTLLCC